MAKVALVDVTRLGQVVDLLVEELGTGQIEFMKARWLHQIQYWDQRSRGARWKYFALRGVVVLGGVSIPVLAAAQASLVIAGIISAAVAAAAAWEGVANYGQIWLEKRRAAEVLKCEGWLFFQGAAKYAGQPLRIAAATFAAEVEQQIAKEVGEYVANFDVDAATARVKQTQQMLEAAGIKPSQGGGAPTARG